MALSDMDRPGQAQAGTNAEVLVALLRDKNDFAIQQLSLFEQPGIYQVGETEPGKWDS